MNSKSAAYTGILFVLPFVIANFIVSLRIEPFYSLLSSYEAVRNSSLTPFVLLLFFPVGAFIAIRPTLQKGIDGKHKFYILNSIVATILLVTFFLLASFLVGDLYRCDILKIPNCD